MYNTFILNFSPFLSDPSPQRILEYVRGHAFTYQYLVPFSGTIIVKSTAGLELIVKSYTPFFQPSDFLLTQANPSFINGLLQSGYWDWINSNSPPALTSS